MEAQRIFAVLGKEEGVEFCHESVIEGREIFETFWAGFLQSLEKENLVAGIQLLQELAELGHGIAPRRDAENVVDEALHELLPDIVAGNKTVGNLSAGNIFMKRDSHSGKGQGTFAWTGHASLQGSAVVIDTVLTLLKGWNPVKLYRT
jgi:hypothetical protein